MSNLSLHHTDRLLHVSRGRKSRTVVAFSGSGGKCYDTAIHVFVVRSRVSCYESKIERPLCRESQLRLGGSIVGPIEEGTFHTLIAAPPKEYKSHEHPIPPTLPSIPRNAKTSSPSPMTSNALFVKAASRKVWPWYRPCTSLHRSSSGSEEYGLHRDIMAWAEQLAPENPGYRHHQTGEDNGDAHLKNLRLASPGCLAHHQCQN